MFGGGDERDFKNTKDAVVPGHEALRAVREHHQIVHPLCTGRVVARGLGRRAPEAE